MRNIKNPRFTFDEAKRRLSSKHEGRVEFVSTEWHGTMCWYLFKDVDFGEWRALYCNVIAGGEHPRRAMVSRSKTQSLSETEIQMRIDRIHDHRVKLIGEYKGMLKKTRFLDVDFGEFDAFPANVIHKRTGHIKRAVQRREQTSNINFGHRHPMQSPEIHDKQIRSGRKFFRINHWKTGVELYCMNRWELAFVRWLNERREDFLWQPQTFKMPDGFSYRPDALLVERNLWIEIKGWYTEKSRKKCEWFKTFMPNFEIWFKEDLVKNGIL